MMDAIGRARLLGALLLMVSFGAGVAVGHYLVPRRIPDGVVISVRASRGIPRELEDLDLTDPQRTRIREILRGGTQRTERILRSFMAPMDAAIDSTDREIRAVLSASQIRMLDEIRRTHPLKQMQEKRIIDTAR